MSACAAAPHHEVGLSQGKALVTEDWLRLYTVQVKVRRRPHWLLPSSYMTVQVNPRPPWPQPRQCCPPPRTTPTKQSLMPWVLLKSFTEQRPATTEAVDMGKPDLPRLPHQSQSLLKGPAARGRTTKTQTSMSLRYTERL
jgi:hypothetical protein